MAYSALTFTASEVPTLTKWNQLWANDASFNDGTGIGNNAITSAKIATNAVTGDKLGTAAIKLGAASTNTTITQSGTTATTILSVTVTVPSGGRDVLLVLHASQLLPADLATRVEVDFMESTTVFKRYYHNTTGSGEVFMCRIPAPSAGSHTYFVRGTRDGGSGTVQWYADNTSSPASINLEALLI